MSHPHTGPLVGATTSRWVDFSNVDQEPDQESRGALGRCSRRLPSVAARARLADDAGRIQRSTVARDPSGAVVRPLAPTSVASSIRWRLRMQRRWSTSIARFREIRVRELSISAAVGRLEAKSVAGTSELSTASSWECRACRCPPTRSGGSADGARSTRSRSPSSVPAPSPPSASTRNYRFPLWCRACSRWEFPCFRRTSPPAELERGPMGVPRAVAAGGSPTASASWPKWARDPGVGPGRDDVRHDPHAVPGRLLPGCAEATAAGALRAVSAGRRDHRHLASDDRRRRSAPGARSRQHVRRQWRDLRSLRAASGGREAACRLASTWRAARLPAHDRQRRSAQERDRADGGVLRSAGSGFGDSINSSSRARRPTSITSGSCAATRSATASRTGSSSCRTSPTRSWCVCTSRAR